MTKLIALDDGHGMETAGKRTPVLPNGQKSETGNFMHENEFNRKVVKYLDEELKRCGFKTLLVAPTDADTSLEARTNLANAKKADLYLSVHANANAGKWFDGGGIETFIYPSGESKRIGNIIHKHIIGGSALKNRGVKDGSHLWVIRKTSMPSVLVELGFMDSNQDYKFLLSDTYRKECAVEIAKALCEAYGVKYVAPVVAKPTPAPTPKPTTEMYRVRKTWADVASQIGAYKDLDSAKALADARAKDGYEVYDNSGKVAHTPKVEAPKPATPTPAPTPTPVAPTPVVPATEEYVIVGTFDAKVDAEKILKELEKLGIKAFLVKE